MFLPAGDNFPMYNTLSKSETYVNINMKKGLVWHAGLTPFLIQNQYYQRDPNVKKDSFKRLLETGRFKKPPRFAIFDIL